MLSLRGGWIAPIIVAVGPRSFVRITQAWSTTKTAHLGRRATRTQGNGVLPIPAKMAPTEVSVVGSKATGSDTCQTIIVVFRTAERIAVSPISRWQRWSTSVVFAPSHSKSHRIHTTQSVDHITRVSSHDVRSSMMRAEVGCDNRRAGLVVRHGAAHYRHDLAVGAHCLLGRSRTRHWSLMDLRERIRRVKFVEVRLVLFLHRELFVRFGQAAHVLLKMRLSAQEELFRTGRMA